MERLAAETSTTEGEVTVDNSATTSGKETESESSKMDSQNDQGRTYNIKLQS